MRRIAGAARDQPILDIGVGGGRTVPLLRSLSADYVGVDYVVELVRAARRRFPHVRIEHMDARDLGDFADRSFAVVIFSRNGIDAVLHADRRQVFHEIHRVLRPGGLLAYSTHNLDHPSASRLRWHLDRRQLVRHPQRTLRRVIRLPSSIRNYWRLRMLNTSGEGWATIATFGYGHAVAWHHVTFAEAVRELRSSGFSAVELYGSTGLLTSIEDPAASVRDLDTSDLPSLHLVARRP